MTKCIKMTFSGSAKSDFLQKGLQKYVKNLKVEGIAQVNDEGIFKIIVCGEPDTVDLFVDFIYKESVKAALHDIEVEPFLKDKDYRGVFRIIE